MLTATIRRQFGMLPRGAAAKRRSRYRLEGGHFGRQSWHLLRALGHDPRSGEGVTEAAVTQAEGATVIKTRRRAELLRKLVTTLHLNVSERSALGGKVSADEVIGTILTILDSSKFFPTNARPWREGQPCGDGTILEVLPGGAVRAHLQASSAWMLPAHISSRDFPDARSAAAHLVRTDFANGIDGVPVVWPTRTAGGS